MDIMDLKFSDFVAFRSIPDGNDIESKLIYNNLLHCNVVKKVNTLSSYFFENIAYTPRKSYNADKDYTVENHGETLIQNI